MSRKETWLYAGKLRKSDWVNQKLLLISITEPLIGKDVSGKIFG